MDRKYEYVFKKCRAAPFSCDSHFNELFWALLLIYERVFPLLLLLQSLTALLYRFKKKKGT